MRLLPWRISIPWSPLSNLQHLCPANFTLLHFGQCLIGIFQINPYIGAKERHSLDDYLAHIDGRPRYHLTGCVHLLGRVPDGFAIAFPTLASGYVLGESDDCTGTTVLTTEDAGANAWQPVASATPAAER